MIRGGGYGCGVSVRLQLRADRREDTRCADPGPTSGHFAFAVGPFACRNGEQSLSGEAFESGWIRVGRGVRTSRFAAALAHDLRHPLQWHPAVEFAAQPFDDVGVGIGHSNHHLEQDPVTTYPGPVSGKTVARWVSGQRWLP